MSRRDDAMEYWLISQSVHGNANIIRSASQRIENLTEFSQQTEWEALRRFAASALATHYPNVIYSIGASNERVS